jgi:murein DD-endopeptidase MepM/ murein hydrolase activator NlpD
MNRARHSTTARALLRPRRARIAVAALALAAPASALAAEPLASTDARPAAVTAQAAPGGADSQRRGSPAVTDPLEHRALAAAERRERRERRQGPFHPVVGAPADYGDAQAAFGHARGRPHEGQDIFAPSGTTVLAPVDGVVVDGGNDGGRGNWVAIFDPEAKRTFSYFHLLGSATVASGDEVKAGAKVGEVGCTGSCSGDHLHFEIREGRGPYGTAIDPMPFLVRAKAKG